MNSIAITFTQDLVANDKLGITVFDPGGPFGTPVSYNYIFRWVNSEIKDFDVEIGIPTAIPGERSAINFEIVFNLLVGSNNTLTRSGNVCTIQSNIFNYSSPVSYYDSLNGEMVYILNAADIEIQTSSGVSFSPAALSFIHNQNNESAVVPVTIEGTDWKIILKPNFVLTSTSFGVNIQSVTDGTGTYFIASGSVNAVLEISLGDYYNSDINFQESDLSGQFQVQQNNVGIGLISFAIQINKITDLFISPYQQNRQAFTLDPKYFELMSANTDTYFQFDAVIKTYDFFTNSEKQYTIPQKVVLFKGKSKVNLGQIIHRLMGKFEKPNDTFLQYKLAKLTVNCAEKSISDNSIVRYGISPEISFVAGLSRGFSQFGFLEFNPKPNRVTVNSFAYLNMLVPYANYELRTFKNGNLVESSAIAATADHVLCKKVFFNTYAQGDVIEYVLDIIGETNEMAPKKTFIVFPEGNYSNMIVWEDEFLVQKAIECTATASIDSEGEFQSQKRYEDFLEKLEHLSSSKEVKLFINTGWLLFTDIDTIESLMRSKRAWLIQGDDTISLSPTAKKLPKKDLEQELISFPLEFTINRNYDEETYSL